MPPYACPDVLFTIGAASLVVDGTTYQSNGQDVFALPTGTITRTEVWSQVTLATTIPVQIELVYFPFATLPDVI